MLPVPEVPYPNHRLPPARATDWGFTSPVGYCADTVTVAASMTAIASAVPRSSGTAAYSVLESADSSRPLTPRRLDTSATKLPR